MKGKCPRSLKANTRVRPSDHSYLAGQILTMEDVQRLCAAVVPLSEVVGVNQLLRGEGQPWVGERCPLVLMVNIQNLIIFKYLSLPAERKLVRNGFSSSSARVRPLGGCLAVIGIEHFTLQCSPFLPARWKLVLRIRFRFIHSSHF